MPALETNTIKCPIGDVQAAIFDQKPLIEYEVNEKLETRPRYMMAKIMDGGMVDPHDDGTTLIMGKGFQAPVGYEGYDDPKPDQANQGGVTGQQEAQANCGSVTAKFTTEILDTEKDQCNGVCIVDFAQGYRYRGSNDFNIKIATPERCLETLAKKEKRFVLQYLEQESESFSETCFQSFDHKLVSLAVERGGANAVVQTHNNGLPVLTEGGWDVGETPSSDIKHASFYFFEHYRRQIVQRLRQFGKGEKAENYVAEFEVTMDAYKQMVIAETLHRTGDGGYVAGLGSQVRVDSSLFDKTHAMRGKKFAMSPDGLCRFIFNEEPIRGFFESNGTTPSGAKNWNFVRIYHLKNVPDEEMGVKAVYNPEYDYNTITCGGKEYPLMELIPHIHEDSFKRHGLTTAVGPRGVEAVGSNFELQLLQGDALSSGDNPNFFKNKYRYAGRHKFRFRDIYPELSGYIVHRRRLLGGYDIDADDAPLIVTEKLPTATPEVIDNCNEERADNGCDLNEDCVAATDSIISLAPCGTVNTSFTGESHILTLDIERNDACSDAAASVDFTVADDTALKGTHYEVLDSDGNVAALTGTIEWEAGESGIKQLCIRIDAAITDGIADFTVTLDTEVGATLEDCVETTVSIIDRA